MSVFRRKDAGAAGPAGSSAGDLSADLAPALFGMLTETGEQIAARLTRDGVLLRRRDQPDALITHPDVAGAAVQGGRLVLTLSQDVTLSIEAEDPAGYPGWLVALGAPPIPAAVPAAVPADLPAPTAGPVLLGRARPPALLVLEDGTTYRGTAFGADGESFGEAVFNTGMTGYQETLTDPSYHRQVVVMTAPHIGNTGTNTVDPESGRIWVAGFVVREPSPVASSWRARRGLDAELREGGVVGVAGVDTRAITRHLRDRGAMRCAVSSVEADADALIDRVRSSASMAGADLAREVTTPHPYVVPAVGERRFRVVAVDLGMKRSTPAYLAAHGIEVQVLPATATAEDVLALGPDGAFFSNGPGDPAATSYAVDTMRGLLGRLPVFGICLGNQILGRALGLDTFKLRFGHRGVNQPVQDLVTGRVAITSHNHGFAIAAPSDVRMPIATPYGDVAVSHVDLNDGVVEGLRCLDIPAFSVQYHPEAAPGPHDATGLFADFADLMAATGVRQ